MKPAVGEQLLHFQPSSCSDRRRPHQRGGVVESWACVRFSGYGTGRIVGVCFLCFFQSMNSSFLQVRRVAIDRVSRVRPGCLHQPVCQSLKRPLLCKHLKNGGTLTFVCLFLAVRPLWEKRAEAKTSGQWTLVNCRTRMISDAFSLWFSGLMLQYNISNASIYHQYLADI